MPANIFYNQDGEMKIGVCDATVFRWLPQASRDSEILVIPFGETGIERVPKWQINYIVQNCIICTKQGSDWHSRIMTAPENAEIFAQRYLGFQSSLRCPVPERSHNICVP